LEHLLDEIHRAVTGGLAAHQCSAPARALAGEHARLVAVGDALVLAEEIADLARPDADITGGHIRVLADVMAQRGHEALAEAHDLVVRTAFRIEIGAALRATDGQSGERVLEHLLETQELDDA